MTITRPSKILLTRRAALGDVVMTTGIVRELRKKYGATAEITVSTDYPQVFANNPHVNAVYDFKSTPASGWDVVYDLDDAYELNPAGHFVDTYYNRVFGLDHGLDQSMELYPTATEKAKVDEDLMYISSKFIAVHMRQWHWELKNIKPEVWFDMLLGIFENTTEYKIVCVGGETDFAVDHPLVVNYNGRYSPAELTYLLDHAECFVGIDSGPFHCAGASSTPILALLNHVHPEYILPYRNGTMGSNCHVIQAAVDCLGCHARQAVPVRSIKCEKNNFSCNSTWDGKQISKKILEIISV